MLKIWEIRFLNFQDLIQNKKRKEFDKSLEKLGRIKNNWINICSCYFGQV